MPVKVKCTSCEKVLSVPDAARGKAVKCPQCQTRIPVPAEGESAKSSTKSAASKSKTKKPAKPLDSEAALASFDMRRAEDTEARICSKCGFDMVYQDEEETECPQCGYDSEEGGMGVKARKKAMKGPDPADFYPGLFKQSWNFVGRNQTLAYRTVMYTLICLAVALGCGFLYLYISMWPPRVFFALCFTISFLVIPGWMWFLDTEVIKLTLERKDKFKKLNFDFFLASAMGAAFVFWCIVVLLPLMALPAGLGYLLVNYGGLPEFVLPICAGLGTIPAVWMLPVVMSHMSMPVQYPGWMVWKLVPIWAKNVKPLTVWLLWFLVTNIPNIAGVVTIAAVYGPSIVAMANTMEDNAIIRRKAFDRIQNPSTKKKGQVTPVLEPLPDPTAVSFKPLIVPCVILAVMGIINGFTSLFNMRTNGQFTYYHKNSLDMIGRQKEYKYKAKERRDEEDDDKPKTIVQHMVDALVILMVFDLFGLVGGMLYGSLTDAGAIKGIVAGMLIGSTLACLAAFFNCVKEGFIVSPLWGFLNLFFHPIAGLIFIFKEWELRQSLFFQLLITTVAEGLIVIAAFVVGVLPLTYSEDVQQPGDPSGMPQGMDPSQIMGQPGAPGQAPSGPPAP